MTDEELEILADKVWHKINRAFYGIDRKPDAFETLVRALQQARDSQKESE